MSDGVPATCSCCSLVQRVQRYHTLVVEDKIEDVAVLNDSRGSVGFGQWDYPVHLYQLTSQGTSYEGLTVSLLERPANEDLSRSPTDLHSRVSSSSDRPTSNAPS